MGDHDRAQPSSWMCQVGLLGVSPGQGGCWGMGLQCLVSQLSWGFRIFPRRAGWHSRAGQAHTPSSSPYPIPIPVPSPGHLCPSLPSCPHFHPPQSSFSFPFHPSSTHSIPSSSSFSSPSHPLPDTGGKEHWALGLPPPTRHPGDFISSHSLKAPCPFPVPGRPQLILVPPTLGPAECAWDAGDGWAQWVPGAGGWVPGVGSAQPPTPIPPGRDSAGASSATWGVGLALQTTPVARGHPLPQDHGQSRGQQWHQSSERPQTLLAHTDTVPGQCHLCSATLTPRKAHGGAQGVPHVGSWPLRIQEGPGTQWGGEQ